MEEKRGGGSSINWQTLLLLTVVAGGVSLIPSSLHSSRPSDKESMERASLGDQVVPARLWVDPLEAVGNYTKSNSKVGSTKAKGSTELHQLTELAGQIVRQSKTFRSDTSSSEGSKITVLEVMVTGGTYAEDAEIRHRTRYAVLTALGVSGYAPADPEHLGYCELKWPRGAMLERQPSEAIPRLTSLIGGANPAGNLEVPFEWFQLDKLQPDRVVRHSTSSKTLLILWLNANAFEDHPAKRLGQFNWELRQAVSKKAGAENLPDKILAFKMLDPRLHSIFDEMSDFAVSEGHVLQKNSPEAGKTFSLKAALNGLEIYSTYATTADALLVPDCTTNRRETVSINLQEQYGVKFYNATCTDDELAKALIDELQLRGVDPVGTNGKAQRIALVSEWDTFYGRSLPLTFAAEVLRQNPTNTNTLSQIIAKLRTDKDAWPKNICCFSYLRGVDGKLPGEESHHSDAGKEKNKDAEQADRPEGHSQLDYMPRMAGMLDELEKTDGSDFKALGILGSDVYDKLLVLQALRPHFTDELFFTTDLDARMLHPAEQKWTRNIIVASSFGLRLDELYQQTTPPFRDTYQTAQYLATFAAIGGAGIDHLAGLSPRVFEIARDGAFDLSTKFDCEVYPARSSQSADENAPGQSIAKNCWRLGLGLIFVVLLAAQDPLNGRLQKIISTDVFRPSLPGQPTNLAETAPSSNASSGKWWLLAGATMLSLSLLVSIMIVKDHDDLSGEPFSLFNGISIWPAEIIRLIAAALSLFFFLKTRSNLFKSKEDFPSKFGLPDALETEEIVQSWENENGPGSYKKTLQRLLSPKYWRWISIASWDVKKNGTSKLNENEVDAGAEYDTYNRLGFFHHRFLRFSFSSVLYLALSLLILTHFETLFRPYRGHLSFIADNICFNLSLILQIFLTFYVIDATQLCRKLIVRLAEGEAHWPEKTVEKFEKEYGLHRNYLHDWITIRVIAERSRAVGQLILYPFIGLFLLIISRNNFFDRWDWPLPLTIVFGLISVYAVIAVLCLRRGAEEAKEDAIAGLNQKLLRVLGGEKPAPISGEKLEKTADQKQDSQLYKVAKPPSSDRDAQISNASKTESPTLTHTSNDAPKLVDQIRLLIQEIKDCEEGAFAPLSKHPVVAAAMMPFGGAGVLTLLDRMAQ